MEPVDGFWFPQGVREQVLSAKTEYATLSFARGRPCGPGDEGAVTVRWPMLQRQQWDELLAALHANRRRAPQGQAYWDRFQVSLQPMARRLADPSDPLRVQALATLPSYTGYSEAMIGLTLAALDMWSPDQLYTAFGLDPTRQAAIGWQPMDGLPGRLRFFPDSPWHARPWLGALWRLPGRGRRPLFGPASPLDLVVGYGAGNVPGAALLIAFLALATTLAQVPGDSSSTGKTPAGAPPVVVVKNSRREPIFAPLVLSALEAADPDLVATVAVLIWDYEDTVAQEYLLAQADLTLAAASDETIAQIKGTLTRSALSDRPAEASPERSRRISRPSRFHAHGHKVSFSAIGREVLACGLDVPSQSSSNEQATGQPLLDVAALLAALDSVFWDQHGCLSSRIHFVESGGEGFHTPLEYAERLAAQMRLLAAFLPRGAWPRQRLHDRFDRYKLLETSGQAKVLSDYDDEFVVALDQRTVDERALGAAAFQAVVNDCEGRVVIVRPVADLMEVPDRYLRLLPAGNLQSLSVAVGQEGEGLTDRFLDFADACGARGVTAIRTVGRGAFPQLAYSWDGLIPLDLVRQRPAGRFATIEFDNPHDEMLETYRLMLELGASLGQVEG